MDCIGQNAVFKPHPAAAGRGCRQLSLGGRHGMHLLDCGIGGYFGRAHEEVSEWVTV